MKVSILLSIFILLWLPVAKSSAEVDVIINENIADQNLQQNDIEQIFLGKKVLWSNQSKIVFATIDDSDLHEAFLKSYLNKTPKQFSRYWKKMVFTGQGIPPKKFASAAELLKFVSETPGAIGYVNEGNSLPGTKTLNIQQ